MPTPSLDRTPLKTLDLPIQGRPLLGEILVANGLTTPDMITRARMRMEQTGELLGEALLGLGAVSEESLLQAIALQHKLPYVFSEELPSTLPVIKNVSAKYMKQYVVCPLSVENGILTVATADPLNPIIVDDLRQSTGFDIKIVVSTPTGILRAIERTYESSSALQGIVGSIADEGAESSDEDTTQLRDMAFEAPVVQLVNLLVTNAIDAEASDIHIEPFEDTLRIRYRVDGILFDQESPPRRLQSAVTSRVKIMAEMNIAERRLPQDGRIRVNANGRAVDIRVSTIPTVHGESIVMRLLDRSSVLLPLERLGFDPSVLSRFEALIKRPHGIILVTGPTGSGTSCVKIRTSSSWARSAISRPPRSRSRPPSPATWCSRPCILTMRRVRSPAYRTWAWSLTSCHRSWRVSWPSVSFAGSASPAGFRTRRALPISTPWASRKRAL